MSGNPLSGLGTMTRSEAVVKAVEERIATERIPPGQSLGTKEALRTRYGVARATMNEAVRLLASRGSVEVRAGAHGGVFVAERSASVRLGSKMLQLSSDAPSVADCIQVRNALEPEVISTAALHCNKADIRDLRALTATMNAEELDPGGYLDLNLRLHTRIAHIVPNVVLQDIYLGMVEFIRARVQGVTEEEGFDIVRGARVHAELVEAMASGDSTRVGEAIAAHHALVG